jgi:hypothetical protein
MSSKNRMIRFESRRHFDTFDLPGDAKADNFHPEGQENIYNREHDELTSEIMKIINHDPRSTAFSSEYNESQIEFPDAYTRYLIDSKFLIENKNYIHAQRDIDEPEYKLFIAIPPDPPSTSLPPPPPATFLPTATSLLPAPSFKKRKATSLSEKAEDSKVEADMKKYNIYRTSIDGTTMKLNTEQLSRLLKLTKAYYKERPYGAWYDGGKPRKTRKQKRNKNKNKTKRHKGKTRK